MSTVGNPFSLVVKGGTLIIQEVGLIDADIGIAQGRIAAIGENLAAEAADVYDAAGKTVLPGIFDPHVHIGNERSFEEESETETRGELPDSPPPASGRHESPRLPAAPHARAWRSAPAANGYA